MALLFPCENEISAHLLRSRLLSHGIPSDVVQDNFATMYGNWLTRPHLLISEEALADGLEILAAPEDSLDESFTEPAETAEASEDLGLRCDMPGFGEIVVIGFKAGFLVGTAGLLFLTFSAIAINGSRAFTDSRLDVVLLPFRVGLSGIILGIAAWPLIAFARTCRRREDGLLPLRARIITFFYPDNILLYFIAVPVFVIIDMLR